MQLHTFVETNSNTMKKTITIFQMSEDSIDVENQIEIEIYYSEPKFSTINYFDIPEPSKEAEITEITYEGREISHLIATMFDDGELLYSTSDLETSKDLSAIINFVKD